MTAIESSSRPVRSTSLAVFSLIQTASETCWGRSPSSRLSLVSSRSLCRVSSSLRRASSPGRPWPMKWMTWGFWSTDLPCSSVWVGERVVRMSKRSGSSASILLTKSPTLSSVIPGIVGVDTTIRMRSLSASNSSRSFQTLELGKSGSGSGWCPGRPGRSPRVGQLRGT